MKTSIVGTLTALGLNILLVPHFHAIGSAIVWLLSEICVLITAQIFVNKYMGIPFPFRDFMINILIAVPIVAMGIIIMRMVSYNIATLFVYIFIVAIYYFIVEYFVIKNQMITTYVQIIIQRFCKL